MRAHIIGAGEELPPDTTLPSMRYIATTSGGKPVVVQAVRNGIYWSYVEMDEEDHALAVTLLVAAGAKAFGNGEPTP